MGGLFVAEATLVINFESLDTADPVK